MKFKKDVSVLTSDWWYDLTTGGHIVPSTILVNDEDIVEAEKSLQILKSFYNEALDNGVIKWM